MEDNESIESDELLQQLTENFREKLLQLSSEQESTPDNKEDLHSLRNYVSELSEQNEILVQTIEDLEKDANDKTEDLETQLQSTNSFLKEQTNRYEQLQTQLNKYKQTKDQALSHVRTLEEEAISLGEESLRYQSHISKLESDIEVLISTIKQARTTGKWELSKIKLSVVPLESLLDVDTVVDPIPRNATELITENHVDTLKCQLIARDRTIAMLERELRKQTEAYRHLEDQVSHRGEMVNSVKSDMNSLEKQQKMDTSSLTRQDLLIQKLQGRLKELEGRKEDWLLEINNQQDEILTNRQEMNDLESGIKMRIVELENKNHSIQILERQLLDVKEKNLVNSFREDEVDELKLQLRESENKICDLQMYVNELQQIHRNQQNQQDRQDHTSELEDDLHNANEKIFSQKSKIERLNEELSTCKKKLSSLQLTSLSNQSDVEANLRKDIERKERSIQMLENQVKRLEDQQTDNDAKISTRDKAIERLQLQQKEYMDEVTRRDSALHKLELNLLKIQDEKRRAINETEKVTKKVDTIISELTVVKEQYAALSTEKGKLEAKLKAYQISNESEHTIMMQEVAKREEYIQKLKREIEKFQDDYQQLSGTLKELKQSNSDAESKSCELLEKLNEKEKMTVDTEANVSNLQMKLQENKVKLESFEDEVRELTLKLNASERIAEQETHKSTLHQEHAEELSDEVESLQEENRKLLSQLNSKTLLADKLTNNLSNLKKISQDKEKQSIENSDLLKSLEKNNAAISTELTTLKQEAADDLASRDHKIVMLEEEITHAQQRYADVNEDLTHAELRLEDTNKNYREMFDLKEQLEHKLQVVMKEMEKLELELTITAEKHKTSVQKNMHKDAAMLNLRSELDATQQEFENVIEELTQKNDETAQLMSTLEQMQENYKNLQSTYDESARKNEQCVDQINELQNLTVKQQSELSEMTEKLRLLGDDKQCLVDQYDNDMEIEKKERSDLENNLRHMKQESDSMKLQVASLSEKNTELIALNNSEADQRQNTNFQLEDLREKHEELRIETEEMSRQRIDKITLLETNLHSATLKISSLQGNLNLAEEKVKNYEAQLSECERQTSILQNTVEELQLKLQEQSETIKSTSSDVDLLKETNLKQAEQLHDRSVNTNNLSTDLKSAKEQLKEAKLRNTRCEEIIREMREKLGAKVYECDEKTRTIEQHHIANNNLYQLHERTKDKLFVAEEANANNDEEISSLRDDLSKKQQIIDELQKQCEALKESEESLTTITKSQQTKNEELDGKFEKLKISLEKDNFTLLEENCVLKEKLQTIEENVKLLQDDQKEKTEKNTNLENKVRELKAELDEKDQECDNKLEECYSNEETINEMHDQLQRILHEKKTLVDQTSQQCDEIAQMRSDLIDLTQQYKENAQQLAHFQEKSRLSENNVSTMQEQLSTRITEIVKLEKVVRKLQTELKRTTDEKKAKEIQNGQHVEVMEQTREDLTKARDRCEELNNENKAHKSTVMAYENQLNEAHNQTEHLSIELQQKDNKINESQSTLQQLQRDFESVQDKLETKSKLLKEQKYKLSVLADREEDLSSKLLERDGSNSQLHTELEMCLQKNKSCLEKIASKDAEIRVLKADLHAQQKKASHQEKCLKRNAEQLESYRKDVQSFKNSSKDTEELMFRSETEVTQLRNELSECRANLEESTAQLSDKSKELSSVRTQLLSLQQQHDQSEQQCSLLETKNKRLKSELKRLLERNKASATELAQLVQNTSGLKTQLRDSLGQQENGNVELSKRDQQIISLKVELASLEERFKLKDEENERLKNGSLHLSQQHHRTMEQLHTTKQELTTVKANGDRLTRESELVVDNMNTWVKEQRQGNEKVVSKLNDQKGRIDQLEATNRTLSEENDRLKYQNSSFRRTIDERKVGKEKMEKQRLQSAELQVQNRELKTRIKHLEETNECERVKGTTTIGELHNHIKTNVETIKQLHKQLSELNKENVRQRTLLERQSASRKSLQALLKSKENDLEVMKEDFEKSFSELDTQQQQYSRPTSRTRTDHVSSMLERELEKASGTNEVKDRSYWMNRVGELSSKLQRNGEYWTQKLHSLDMNNPTDSENDIF